VANNDDLLTPEEIEALMQAARSAPPPGTPPAAPANPPSASDPLEDFEPPPRPIVERRAPPKSDGDFNPPRGNAAAWPNGGPDQLLQQAETHLAAALATDSPRPKGPPPELGTPHGFSFPDLNSPAPPPMAPGFPLASLQDVELDLRIELGRTQLLIEDVLQLREGTVVPLDKLAGDPVDILVNGRLIARGEVLVLNDNFCVRVAEILTPEA